MLLFKHVAESRAVFARGAIRAAFYIENKEKGFYDMKSLLEN
jgi:dihydrodipicolinate reductase